MKYSLSDTLILENKGKINLPHKTNRQPRMPKFTVFQEMEKTF